MSNREETGRQREYAKLALRLHSEGANLVAEEWQERLRDIAEQERWHIRVVERILERLGDS